MLPLSSGSVQMAAHSLWLELTPLIVASTPVWPPTLQERRTGYSIWMSMVGLINFYFMYHSVQTVEEIVYMPLTLLTIHISSASCDRRQQWDSRAVDDSPGQFCQHWVCRCWLSSTTAQLAEKRLASASVLTHTASFCWTGAPVGQWTGLRKSL